MKKTEKEKYRITFQPWVEYDDDGTGRYAEGTLIKVNEEIISFSFQMENIDHIKRLLKACGVEFEVKRI